MSQSRKIFVYSRKEKRMFEEIVYGGKYVEFFYSTKVGRALEFFISLPFISKLYGWTQSTQFSKRKIQPFIKKFKIKMDEYKNPGFKSFNDFFIRDFKDGAREFESSSQLMPAICEARYLGYSKITEDVSFPVKGKFLGARDLIGASKYADRFIDGPLVIARLCPVDYHCYHYPCEGRTLEVIDEGKSLHSVNPLALKSIGDLLIKNKRRVSILETKKFGLLAYIEVGATCVGKIVQVYDESTQFKRGDKKGHFLFGGSTVILLGEKGKWEPSKDILEQTQKNKEVFIELGDTIASLL